MVLAGVLLAVLLPIPEPLFPPTDLLHVTISVRELNGRELLRIGEIHDVQNHHLESLTYYEQALASFRRNKRHRDEAVALFKIGSVMERQGRREAAAARLEESLRLFEKFPAHPMYPFALLTLGRVSAWLGAREQAGRLFERARDRFLQAGDLQGLGTSKLQLGLLWISDGRTGEGVNLLQETLKDAQARRDDNQALAASLALGDGWWVAGALAAALPYYREALTMARRQQQPRFEAQLLHRLSALLEAMGQPERAIEFAESAVTSYRLLRDPSGEAAAWTLLANLLSQVGEEQRADDARERALLLYQHQQIVVHAIP